MKCPKCSADVGVAELTTPPRGAIAKAILLDWRVWVGAFAIMASAGILASLIHTPSAGTVGGGAAIGIIVAMRMGRLRRCPKCGAVITIPGAQAQTS